MRANAAPPHSSPRTIVRRPHTVNARSPHPGSYEPEEACSYDAMHAGIAALERVGLETIAQHGSKVRGTVPFEEYVSAFESVRNWMAAKVRETRKMVEHEKWPEEARSREVL